MYSNFIKRDKQKKLAFLPAATISSTPIDKESSTNASEAFLWIGNVVNERFATTYMRGKLGQVFTKTKLALVRLSFLKQLLCCAAALLPHLLLLCCYCWLTAGLTHSIRGALNARNLPLPQNVLFFFDLISLLSIRRLLFYKIDYANLSLSRNSIGANCKKHHICLHISFAVAVRRKAEFSK